MKPSIPQGTRDFNAETLLKRNYIFQTIKNVFELYGFQPLETPAMENLETLLGKYGDEGDKLIYRVLESGNPFGVDFFKSLSEYLKSRYEFYETLKDQNPNLDNPFKNSLWNISPEYLTIASKELIQNASLSKLKSGVSEKALRYDLTIPFARYVAMNYGQLSFPFKRYQIQPVWRADRPQKGRYREFYQCDADIVGSNSLLNEVEFANIYIDVFKKLNIDIELKINNRKILTALAETVHKHDAVTDITIAIDKLDKIGLEKVKLELADKNLSENNIAVIEKYLLIDGDNQTKINKIKELLGNNETGKKGSEELEYILNFTSDIRHQTSNITIDFTLARGLNYYTGTIFEVKAKNVQIGSIGGGGRYDDLTGLFDVPNVPGVGISFGVDRIYDVMQDLKLFPSNMNISTQVLFFNLGEEECKVAYNLMQQLRNNNISCEIYHEKAKFDKQFKYAERKNIIYTAIIGNNEIESKTCIIKNIKTGVQNTIHQTEILEYSFL